MVYKGSVLILDNFRSVLSDYDIDIQDVVRSAILDGIDLSEYIESCKNDAYRLDQVRLAMKTGVPEGLVKNLSAQQLFAVRKMTEKGHGTEVIEAQVASGRLAGCYMDYLISWVSNGVDLTGIKISLIPKKMLEIFDMYLRQGRDMRVFNNGRSYSKDYILYCMTIQKAGKSVERFAQEEWSEDLLSHLAVVSSSVSSKVWAGVMSVLSPTDSRLKASLLVDLIKKGVFAGLKDSDVCAFDVPSLSALQEAVKLGFNYKPLLECSLSSTQRQAMVDEMKMNRGKKVGGVLRHGSSSTNV